MIDIVFSRLTCGVQAAYSRELHQYHCKKTPAGLKASNFSIGTQAIALVHDQ
ncbi:hypothetical protein [Agrobacterium tumefaciens]|uniref:hypothetical protein n=1 Tax=Agrobacterium tumefaciens TaxID=358 RepID=UPI0013AFBC17|nr:hypothetical protein [Agrobacterium tumefaciens]